MSVRGKSINLFLMDGTPNGRIKCTLANWTEAVVFTTSNNSFGPTEISYLENKFCGLALNAGRYIVKNGNDPTPGNITEEKECELEEFIDYAKIVMGALGYKLFEPLTEKPKVVAVEEPFEEEVILFLKRKSSKSGIVIEARCKQTNEGFVVLKGSIIETIDSQSIPNTIKERREKAEIDEEGILQEDVLFKSPSYAASFVIGGHVNGLTEWKTKEGISLKELENM